MTQLSNWINLLLFPISICTLILFSDKICGFILNNIYIFFINKFLAGSLHYINTIEKCAHKSQSESINSYCPITKEEGNRHEKAKRKKEKCTQKYIIAANYIFHTNKRIFSS